MSNSLQPHESQHTRPPCPSPTPSVHSNSCASSWWCHLAISSLVVPFSSCPQSLPAWGSFPMSQLYASGGQSIGASALPMNTQDWSPLVDWLDLVAVQRTLKSLLQHHSSEASILCSAYWSQETPPLGLNKPELFLSPKPSQTSCALPVYRAPVGAD